MPLSDSREPNRPRPLGRRCRQQPTSPHRWRPRRPVPGLPSKPTRHPARTPAVRFRRMPCAPTPGIHSLMLLVMRNLRVCGREAQPPRRRCHPRVPTERPKPWRLPRRLEHRNRCGDRKPPRNWLRCWKTWALLSRQPRWLASPSHSRARSLQRPSMRLGLHTRPHCMPRSRVPRRSDYRPARSPLPKWPPRLWRSPHRFCRPASALRFRV